MYQAHYTTIGELSSGCKKGLCCLDGGGHLQFFSTVISGLRLQLIEGGRLIGERLMKVQL